VENTTSLMEEVHSQDTLTTLSLALLLTSILLSIVDIHI